MNWKKILLGILGFAALAPWARAQTFGVGGSAGWAFDVGNGSGTHTDVNGWVDYRFEPNALLRFTYGSMRTQQSNAPTITTFVPAAETRELKERIQYYTLGVSYLFPEGFFTSGLFAGLGGYQIRPDVLPDGLAGTDRRETVFGWNLGTEAFFRVYKGISIVGRATYHNVSAHPHRQIFTLNAGAVARF